MVLSVAALLASLAVFVPVPADVNVVREGCPSYPEFTVSCATSTGTIYLAPNLKTNQLRVTLAHELGHVWDDRHLTAADHIRYAQMIGLPDDPWRQPSFDPLLSAAIPPAERFADAYALCAIGPRARRNFRVLRTIHPNGDYFGLYGEEIHHQALANTCWLIHHAQNGTTR